MKVKIKKGAYVHQDMRMRQWPDTVWKPKGKFSSAMKFDAEPMPGKHGTLVLRAKGFGLSGVKDGYGCGSLFVDYADVEPATMKDAMMLIADLRREIKEYDKRSEMIRKAVNG